jgi:hypothetical protein
LELIMNGGFSPLEGMLASLMLASPVTPLFRRVCTTPRYYTRLDTKYVFCCIIGAYNG